MADNDFTKKLRAAIRAKILELGMEVDDELPDYIMVMIANKKDRTRMKTDLTLFLGDHTDVFVDWMFDFFEKVGKKDSDDTRSREEAAVSNENPSSSIAARRSRSRSPLSRSKSPKRSVRHRSDDKPKRAPIRAPSPRRERDSRRRRRTRSRSPRRREERRRVTYDSDDNTESKSVRSHVVAKNRHEREPSPKLNSQVIVKRKKPESTDVKGSSAIFRRAMASTVEEESMKPRKRHHDDGILQVNTARSIRRVISAEEEPEETRFVVRVGRDALGRRIIDDGPPGDENFVIKRRRRLDDPGVRKTLDAGMDDFEDVIIRKRRNPGNGVISKQWDGKIEITDEEEDDSDDNEAEIDAFLATAHDSRIPPTEALSRPIYAVPQKRAFNKAIDPAVPNPKSAERCRFWPNCRNEGACPFAHPLKPCLAFPNCWYGEKCHFAHPRCKYEPNCTKAQCPYAHTVQKTIVPRHNGFPRPTPGFVPGAEGDAVGTAAVPPLSAADIVEGDDSMEHPVSELVNTSQSIDNDVGMENEVAGLSAEEIDVSKPDVLLAPVVPNAVPIRPLNSAAAASVLCRFGVRCHSEVCSYRHPKKCRYDEACTNESCYFWHPKKNNVRFRWTKT